jgi:hypothetical protein
VKHATETPVATNQQRRNLIIASIGALVLLLGVGIIAMQANSGSSSKPKTVETRNSSSNVDAGNQRSGDPAEGSSTTRVRTGAAGNRGGAAARAENRAKREQRSTTTRDGAANRPGRNTTTTQAAPVPSTTIEQSTTIPPTLPPESTTTTVDPSTTTTVP